jgi:hypothetical protein
VTVNQHNDSLVEVQLDNFLDTASSDWAFLGPPPSRQTDASSHQIHRMISFLLRRKQTSYLLLRPSHLSSVSVSPSITSHLSEEAQFKTKTTPSLPASGYSSRSRRFRRYLVASSLNLLLAASSTLSTNSAEFAKPKIEYQLKPALFATAPSFITASHSHQLLASTSTMGRNKSATSRLPSGAPRRSSRLQKRSESSLAGNSNNNGAASSATNTSIGAKKAKLSLSASSSLPSRDEYTAMKVIQLKELLKQNELPVSGAKAELVDRIMSMKQAAGASSSETPTTAFAVANGGNASSTSGSEETKPKGRTTRRGKSVLETTATNGIVDTAESSERNTSKGKGSSKGAEATVTAATVASEAVDCLPRTRELQLTSKNASLFVVGVDEAGRGPLAG